VKLKRRYNKWDNSIFYTIRYSGIHHREDGPAIIYSNSEYWFRYGNLHRKDGPAVIRSYIKEWYINGKRHRVGGPAVEWLDGAKKWYINGKCHRDDGPAAIYNDGILEWWLDGDWFETKEEWFEALTEDQKLKMLYSEYFIEG
jgi:hypothetical protein